MNRPQENPDDSGHAYAYGLSTLGGRNAGTQVLV